MLWRKPRQHLMWTATPRGMPSWTLVTVVVQALLRSTLSYYCPTNVSACPWLGISFPWPITLLTLPVGPPALPSSGVWNTSQPRPQQAHLPSCSQPPGLMAIASLRPRVWVLMITRGGECISLARNKSPTHQPGYFQVPPGPHPPTTPTKNRQLCPTAESGQKHCETPGYKPQQSCLACCSCIQNQCKCLEAEKRPWQHYMKTRKGNTLDTSPSITKHRITYLTVRVDKAVSIEHLAWCRYWWLPWT